MAKTVGNLKDSVSGLLTGTNLDNVTGVYAALERASRRMLQKADVPDTIAQSAVTLYDGVFDYAAPSNIFGGTLYDLRVQGNSRLSFEFVQKEGIEIFDRQKALLRNGYKITFEYNNGSPIMRVSQGRASPRIVLDAMSATTGWAAAGNASGLAEDDTVFYDLPASLRFNLAASGSQGTLTKTLPSNDLTNYKNVGVVFLAVRIPSASHLTSAVLRLGSSASAYYTVTATTGFIKVFTTNQWMLIAFDLSTATTVGSPTITAINYAQLLFNYDGTAMNNFYVGSFFIALPSPHTLFYGTNAIFQKASDLSLGTTILFDTDTILLNEAAYTLLEYECALEVGFQQGGDLSSPTLAYLNRILNDPNDGLYEYYRSDNPSQELRTVGNYYDD